MHDIPAFAQMQNALFPFMGGALFALLHFYIYKALLKSLSTKPTPRLVWKLFSLLNALACIAYLFLRNIPTPQVLYFLLSLALGVCYLLTLAALLYQLCSLFILPLRTKSARSRWRHRSKLGVFALTLCIFAVGIYNGAQAPHIVRVNVELEGLSAPLKVAVLSDIHIGGLMESHKVGEIVTLTNELEADMIFLVGDIVDARLSDVEGAVDELGKLRAREGIFYVLGNHEYFHDIEHILDKMRALGFRVLLNQSYTNENLNIAGLADFMGWRVGKLEPNLAKALEHINPNLPTILLAHQPKVISLFSPNEPIDLVISGHTHGGQMFPLSLAMRLQQPFISGLHTLSNLHQSKVYVTQGAGFWGPPMRLGSQREITLITLTPPH